MRDIQNKRDAEAKMQEKIHQGLLRDKKDLEKRIADILGKMDE